jgi:hypothetical protein
LDTALTLLFSSRGYAGCTARVRHSRSVRTAKPILRRPDTAAVRNVIHGRIFLRLVA